MVDCAWEVFVSAQVFIARQPIFDRQRRLAGYELLFRSGDEAGRASFDSDEDATSSVVLNTMTGTGSSRVRVGRRTRPPGSDHDGGGPVIDI